MSENFTPLQRVLTTLSHKEPDRVPVFLLLTMHGARELQLSVPEYYKNPFNMVEAQMRMADKFGHDCLYGFWYAAGEAAAFGSEVIFYDDGPPNAGEPVAKQVTDLLARPVPDPKGVSPLKETLDAIHMLSQRNQGYRPIVGVVMAPFSLPVMLLGLERWITMLYEEPDNSHRLLKYLSNFVVAWANAQFEAGANAMAFFDPMASVTMVTPEQFETYNLEIVRQTISQIKGPCAYHFASARAGPVLDFIPGTGAAAVVLGSQDNLKAARKKLRGKLNILGSLNGIEMVRWTQAQAEAAVKKCIGEAAPGGGFILTDQHGEIPFYVPDDTLHNIVEAAHRWGKYPINWAEV